MNVVVTEDSQSLTITQRYSLSYKLRRIFYLLLFNAALPAFVLYFVGTSATLTCAREAGAGVVCTDRLDWFGSFERGWRYERVEQAYVPARLTPGQQASAALHLKTAAGLVKFSSIHQRAYANFASAINAFIQTPVAGELVVSDPVNIPIAMICAGILLAVFYSCLALPLRTGLITIFDLRQGQIVLHREGFWRSRTSTLALTNILTADAGAGPPYSVSLATTGRDVLLCWFGDSSSAAPAAEARLLAARIKRWLPHLRMVNPSVPPPTNLIEVADPDLAYLLGYSESNAAVVYANTMHLRMDRIIATADQKRNIRAALEPAPPRWAWTPDVLARELVAICQVDLHEALDAAGPQQRAALVRLLGSLPQP
jgi:hypothetical protein